MGPPPPGDHGAVVIEADGGSRGNPGAAAYGAVLMDAATGDVIAERAECIGTATNNVAEYRGLLAGLELYNEHTPGAELEVRMDSKLVVEQMSGRWKIKHPGMVPLATAANRLAPSTTTYTWIPREQNVYADRILNEALDAAAGKPPKKRAAAAAVEEEPARPVLGWQSDRGAPTTLVLVRHGETEHSREERFSGTGGADPGLNPNGRAQVRATAEWLGPLADEVDVLVSSPLRPARETAEIVAELLGRPVELDDGLTEAAFGTWDGLTSTEVHDRHTDDLDAWLRGLDVSPTGGGESFRAVDRRVRRTRDRLIAGHPGQTVLAVTHQTPIKILVRLALGAPLDSVFHMELATGSVTVISWFPDGRASMRLFNARPMEAAFLHDDRTLLHVDRTFIAR